MATRRIQVKLTDAMVALFDLDDVNHPLRKECEMESITGTRRETTFEMTQSGAERLKRAYQDMADGWLSDGVENPGAMKRSAKAAVARIDAAILDQGLPPGDE